MSRWDERLETHAFFAALTSAREQLRAADELLADTEQRETHARLGRVLDYLEGALKATDPELVPWPLLDQLAASVNQLAAYVQQFLSSPTQEMLDQASGQADAALSYVAQLAPRIAPADVQDLQAAVSSFRRSAATHLSQLEKEVGRTEEELQSQLADLRASATANAEQLQVQQQDVALQKGRLDAAIAEYQSQFSASESQRTQLFTSTLDEVRQTIGTELSEARKSVAAAVTQAEERLVELRTSFEQQGDAILERLGEKEAQAIRVVQAIGNTGLTGGYQKVADQEKAAADLWRWIALGSLAVAALGNAVVLVIELRHGMALSTILAARLSISVPLLALAGYAIAESRSHRHREQQGREMELQLASIDPYLAQFPETKQFEIKEGRVDRFFPGLPSNRDGSGP